MHVYVGMREGKCQETKQGPMTEREGISAVTTMKSQEMLFVLYIKHRTSWLIGLIPDPL